MFSDRQFSEYANHYRDLRRELVRRGKPPPPRIAAEGDSWFRGPGTGIPQRLSYRLGTPILNLADGGDTISQMPPGSTRRRRRQSMTHKRQIGRLRNALDAFSFDALLLSGGGNDLLVWADDYVRTGFPAGGGIDDVVIDDNLERLLGDIADAYSDLADLAVRLVPQIKLVVHQYARPVLLGEGQRIGFWSIGPWFSRILDRKCQAAACPPALAKQVVSALFGRLAQRIGNLSSPPDGPFMLVRTLDLLPEPRHWDDELHPSDVGGRLVAEKFEATMQTLFPGRFP